MNHIDDSWLVVINVKQKLNKRVDKIRKER